MANAIDEREMRVLLAGAVMVTGAPGMQQESSIQMVAIQSKQTEYRLKDDS